MPTLKIQLVSAKYKNATGAYHPRYEPVNGEQLVMIYFGQAHCAWSNHREMPELIETIKAKLAIRAKTNGWSFSAMGVALDWVPSDGLGHLAKFGSFDEVAAGFNAANSAALHYFGDRLPEPTTTPQVLVIQRTLEKPNLAAGQLNYHVLNERLLTRQVGLFEIRRWVRNDVPVPGL